MVELFLVEILFHLKIQLCNLFKNYESAAKIVLINGMAKIRENYYLLIRNAPSDFHCTWLETLS